MRQKQAPATVYSADDYSIDYNNMEIVIGGVWTWPLEPSDNGFCVAHTKGAGTVITEVANATYAAWEEGRAKQQPMKRKKAKNAEPEEEDADALKKPAAAKNAEPEEDDADAMKKPAAADSFKKPAAADDHAAEPDALKKPAAATTFMRKPSAADPAAAAEPAGAADPAAAAEPAAETAYTDFDHKTQQFGMEWYKKDGRVGMRIKGSRQAFSFGGARCANTKEELQNIGRRLVQMLNMGEITIAAAEKRAKESVLAKDDGDW